MCAAAQDGYVELEGLSFHFRDWGGEGRDMLLLHGLASNARFWDLSAPHLTEEFRVLALDLRGHGASAKPEDGYDFPTVAADIAAFIQTLALERPLLVGHSWGANVGVQVAADYSGVLTGLVCIDGGTIEPSAAPGATWEDTEQTLAPPDFAAMRLPWEGFLDRARSGRMGALWGDRVEGFLRANFEILPDGTILPYLRRERHMRIVRALWDQQVSNLFPRVACPVLLMPARREEETRTSAGTREEKEAQLTKALELLPQARLVWMEDSIHDVPVQRPVEVARVIRDAARKGFFGK